MPKNPNYSLALYEKAMPSGLGFGRMLECAAQTGFDRLEISIDEARKLYLDTAMVHLLELEQRLGLVKQDQPVVLRVDASVPFNDVVGVLDVLNKYHLRNLSIVTVRKG